MIESWSRRRALVAEEERKLQQAQEAEAQAEREAALDELSDEEVLEQLGLPDPDSLTDSGEFKQFLTDAVPARLKTRALRRMWRVNPALANLDGLLDYGEDFTDSAMIVENMQTAYQVGKGMLKHVEELARQAEVEAAGEDAALAAEGAELAQVAEEDAPQIETPVLNEMPVEMALSAPVDEPMPEPEETFIAPAPSRRMQFSFDTPDPA